MSFDPYMLKKSFPQLEREVSGQALIYFDNGASTLKHSSVTDRVNAYNRFEVSNVHRGAHSLSQWGTEAYEEARTKIKNFINASDDREIIFTRGTTESINLVAQVLASFCLKKGDEILISPFEHHSNIVPWQMVCEQYGCHLKIADFKHDEAVSADSFLKQMTEKTKVCAFLWYSNSFGHRLPVEDIVRECKQRNIISVIDAAQAPLTERMDISQLDCDFLAFSGHKMWATYGIGVLFGKLKWLEQLPPYQGGGSMIDRVTFQKTTYANPPQKFEAGTPNVAGAIGLGIACDVISQLDFQAQHKHVLKLRNQIKDALKTMSSCSIYEFPSKDYTGVLSFNLKGAHPSDVGTLLDKYGIAVRAGHHCTQPLMDLMELEGTVRVSVSAYNTQEEVNFFIETMKKVEGFF